MRYGRNTIVSLLEEWNLVTIVDKARVADKAPVSFVKIVPFKEKRNWQLFPKYNLGGKKVTNEK